MTRATDTTPRVSVVMSVWRPRADFLAQAVDSVLAQSLEDLELVIVEDPPHGAVHEVLARRPDGRVRHVRNPEQSSLALSRNRSLELARADLVAILDADDVCRPERLERQAGYLQAHPDVAVLGTWIRVLDRGGRPRGFRCYPLANEAIVRAMRRYNPLAHPTVMLRRAAVLAAGGYRDREAAACEDYELWSRMALAGHRFANLPDALVDYRLHPDSTKSRRLRKTLRDTLWVKRTYWGDSMDFGDRLRMWGEGLLLRAPAALVQPLFLRMTVRRGLRPVA